MRGKRFPSLELGLRGVHDPVWIADGVDYQWVCAEGLMGGTEGAGERRG